MLEFVTRDYSRETFNVGFLPITLRDCLSFPQINFNNSIKFPCRKTLNVKEIIHIVKVHHRNNQVNDTIISQLSRLVNS